MFCLPQALPGPNLLSRPKQAHWLAQFTYPHCEKVLSREVDRQKLCGCSARELVLSEGLTQKTRKQKFLFEMLRSVQKKDRTWPRRTHAEARTIGAVSKDEEKHDYRSRSFCMTTHALIPELGPVTRNC